LVPSTIAAIPFFARICENALAEVPRGLIEAGNSMGASHWQIIAKILIPESLPSLIRGTTLLVIGLIGYSAMAGVVGGGGLGELAINYGYQRFDLVVMTETVAVLILIVQFVQVIGDYFAKHRAVRPIVISTIVFWIACIGYQIWPAAAPIENTVRVGVMSGESEKVMQVAAKVAEQEFGIKLIIVTFTDYVQPNTALNNQSIDANIFQHAPYLDGQIKARHYKLIPIAKTFVYPMGFYSSKIKQLKQLREGAVIAIPNDPSNGGRSLLLLQKAGLIKLNENAGVYAKINDITANPHHLQIKELDAAQIPRVLNDADLVAITNDFIGPTGLTIKDAVLKEGSDSPYANLIVVREQEKSKPILQKLVEVMHSKPVMNETNRLFPNGAAVPAW
jgi:D-methionine transport system substrate-binding protein